MLFESGHSSSQVIAMYCFRRLSLEIAAQLWLAIDTHVDRESNGQVKQISNLLTPEYMGVKPGHKDHDRLKKIDRFLAIDHNAFTDISDQFSHQYLLSGQVVKHDNGSDCP